MKREIKFRAFDGERMIHFDNMSIGIGKGYKGSKRDKEPYVYFTNDTFNGQVRLGNHEIMQYTGLKDKNGKEIYESDIISSSELKAIVQFGEFDGLMAWHIIINNGIEWALGSGEILGENQNIEIIGNIHQDKHLLK